MKKVLLFVLAVVAVIVLVCNCGGSGEAPKAKMENDIDTLGYIQGYGYGSSFAMQSGFSETYIEDLVRGIVEGAAVESDSAQMAYLVGAGIGLQLRNEVSGINFYITNNDSTEYITLNNLLAGFIAGLKGDTTVVNLDPYTAAMMTRQLVNEHRMREQERQAVELYADNRAAGEAFMAEIAQREGVQALENGVYYEVITAAEGDVPSANSEVEVRYVGTLIDGTEFDKSGEEPTKFNPTQVIPGFSQALLHMPIGAKWKVYIPQEQAYGAQAAGTLIRPFSALVFEIEMVNFTTPQAAQ